MNLKVAPKGSSEGTSSVPLWASVIERQTDNPSPMPAGLLVTSGSKMRAATARASRPGSAPGDSASAGCASGVQRLTDITHNRRNEFSHCGETAPGLQAP